jgi:hypothetical protein
MSTLKVTNVAGLTGSSTSFIEGLAKAWVVLEAVGAHSIYDSFNNSSVADIRTGVVQVNLGVTMGNDDYAITQSCMSTYENTTGSNGRVGISCPQYEGRLNTISYEITQKDSNAVVIDSSRITSLIYGDSA